MTKKRGRPKQPAWWVDVDKYLYAYTDDPQTIKAQKLKLQELELSGIRTTPVYILREGSSGGEAITKEERYVQQMEACREQIRISTERRALIDSILQEYFNDEEREFINLFWLTVPPKDRSLLWIRNKRVIREIGWLRDRDYCNRPSQSFYKQWREPIYQTWWRVLFGDMGQDETLVDYIEYTSLQG